VKNDIEGMVRLTDGDGADGRQLLQLALFSQMLWAT